MVKYDKGKHAGSFSSEDWPMGGFRQTERPMKLLASLKEAQLSAPR